MIKVINYCIFNQLFNCNVSRATIRQIWQFGRMVESFGAREIHQTKNMHRGSVQFICVKGCE